MYSQLLLLIIAESNVLVLTIENIGQSIIDMCVMTIWWWWKESNRNWRDDDDDIIPHPPVMT